MLREHFNWRPWPGLLLRHPVPFVAVVLVGAVASFLYSYIPLHGGKNWQIDHLEQRVDAQNEKLQKLEMEISVTRSDAASRPESGEFESMKLELRGAVRERDQLRAAVKRSEQTITSLRKTRDQWKEKYETLAAAPVAPPASEVAPAGPAPEGPNWDPLATRPGDRPAASGSLPAAPAAGADPPDSVEKP